MEGKHIYHYVYQTTNTINGKIYIGKHSCSDLGDSYLGSGIFLKRAIKVYGRENFKLEILKIFDNEEDAYSYESSLVTEDVVISDKYYNLKLGGKGGISGLTHSKETRAKQSIAAKARIARDGHFMTGVPRKQETKDKISRIMKESGAMSPMQGKKHKESTKALLSACKIGKPTHINTKESIKKAVAGSKWFNNGLINKRIKNGEEIPDGYYKGRLR